MRYVLASNIFDLGASVVAAVASVLVVVVGIKLRDSNTTQHGVAVDGITRVEKLAHDAVEVGRHNSELLAEALLHNSRVADRVDQGIASLVKGQSDLQRGQGEILDRLNQHEARIESLEGKRSAL